jgi:hypothetical protein
MLVIMIARAKKHGQIYGLIPYLVEGGLSILKYAGDTIIFMEHDVDNPQNMKLILCIFEQLPELQIKFHKSDFVVVVDPKKWRISTENYLGVNLGLSQLDTWKSLFIFVDLKIVSINLWMVGLVKVSKLGGQAFIVWIPIYSN